MSRSSAALLASLAQQRLDKRTQRFTDQGESLLDFEKRITPQYERPVHLEAAALILQRSLIAPIRFLFSAPPRHGKSQLLFHLMAMYLARYPDRLMGYASYAADIAESKSLEIQSYAERAGVKIKASKRGAGEWRTEQGGGLIAVGVNGPFTGHGFYLVVVDDPHRNRAEAESPTVRRKVHEWFTSTAINRLEPGGSAVVTHTRWVQDDEIGTLAKNVDADWQYQNYPALDEKGLALWPARWSATALHKRRIDVGEYDWASMFMGEPRPRGSGVFHGTHLYDALPVDVNGRPVPMKLAVGLDLAYTAKTYSDWSVAIVLGKTPDGTIYLLDMLVEQLAAPAFIEKLKTLLATYSWPPVKTFIGGTEKGITDFFVTQGVKVDAEPAKADKFVRAQGVAAAWNRGEVKIPKDPRFPRRMLDKAVSEIASFTGVGDTHDDVVDALAGGYSQLTVPPPARGVGQQQLFPY